MTERIGADGLPNPSPHSGAGETYLHRMCLLLDQVSAQLDRIEQGMVPDYAIVRTTTVPELVTEPAVPQPPAGATDAAEGRKSVRKTRTARTSGKDA